MMDWKVRIRPLSEQDACAMHRYWNDWDVRHSLREGPRFRTIEDAKVFVHFARGRGETGRDMAIDVNGNFAGCISWEYSRGVFSGGAELAYWVANPFRGKGVASESIIQASQFLFGKRNLRRVYAQVSGNNSASAHALERAGYHLEAVMQEAIVIENTIQDCLIYAALRQDWLLKYA